MFGQPSHWPLGIAQYTTLWPFNNSELKRIKFNVILNFLLASGLVNITFYYIFSGLGLLPYVVDQIVQNVQFTSACFSMHNSTILGALN